LLNSRRRRNPSTNSISDASSYRAKPEATNRWAATRSAQKRCQRFMRHGRTFG
jgi:hypothetical protein